jgi:hypothetical protein
VGSSNPHDSRHWGAPRAPDDTPVVELREALAYQRSALGLDFDAAWRYGTAVVTEGMKKPERQSWQIVFDATKADWRRAYDREDRTPRDRRITKLMEDG